MESRIVENFIHPRTKTPLIKDVKNNLCEQDNPENIIFVNDNDIYNFVGQQSDDVERDQYDNFYSSADDRILSKEDFIKMWQLFPGFKYLFESLGDISGKKMLVLGNGKSLKEFYFLQLGAKCVYTDLSIEAVKHMATIFEKSELNRNGYDTIEFHAIDACKLPFPDNSFDIIYGSAFVHHIENLDVFFREVSRCLKPGGICRFMDHAYSPLWQTLKKTVLKPLQKYSHRKHGISPADLVATMRGGYKQEELDIIKDAHNFKDALYLKVAFFELLLQRGTLKFGGLWLRKLRPFFRILDKFLDNIFGLVQKHGIELIWGFTK